MALIKPYHSNFFPKPFCDESMAYDDRHFAKHGYKCRLRHRIHRWGARIEAKGTLVSDSLCKWVRGLPYLDVQALPGLKTETAIQQVLRGNIVIHDYEFVFLHLATNDVENTEQTLGEFERDMGLLTSLIKRSSPYCTIAVCSILPRPKDKTKELIEHCFDMNRITKAICEKRGYFYLEGGLKFVNTDGTTNLDLYADDLLHMSERGTRVLYEYYQGAMGSVMDKTYRYE
jgi:hypothetical protein